MRNQNKPKIFIRTFEDVIICYHVKKSKPVCTHGQKYKWRTRRYLNGGGGQKRGGENQDAPGPGTIDNKLMESALLKLLDEMSVFIGDPNNKAYILSKMSAPLESTKESVYATLQDNFVATNRSKIMDDIMEKYKNLPGPTPALYNSLLTTINSRLRTKPEAVATLSIMNSADGTLDSDIGENLLQIILTRAASIYSIGFIKKILEAPVAQKVISKETEEKILKALEEKPASVFSKASAITDKAFAGLTSGALKLAEWMSPVVISDPSLPKYNETAVQLLWYPRKHINYAKGNAIPSEKTKYGDLVVKIDDKYANLQQYFSKLMNGTDDLLANIASREIIPKPFKKRTLTTKENTAKTGNVEITST